MGAVADRVRAIFAALRGTRSEIVKPRENWRSPSTLEQRLLAPGQAEEIMDSGWVPLNSSAVLKARFKPYSHKTREGPDASRSGDVWLVFRNGNGKEYKYPAVPARVFAELQAAASKGRYVDDILRRIYSVGPGRFRRRGKFTRDRSNLLG